MAKEQEIQEPQLQQPVEGNVATPTKRDQWLQNMRGKYPDIQDEDELYGKSMEGYDTEHDYAKRSREELQEFAQDVNNNPQLLAFYQKVQELGADNAEMALAELGDDLASLLTGEIDSEVYQERKRRKAETDAESARLTNERNEKSAAQRAALEAWCEQKGYDVEEWRERVMEKLLNPISSFSTDVALFETLDNMLNYDTDVEAAEVKGRNANITAQRRRQAAQTDGQMNGGSAAAGAQPQKRGNSIFDVARGAE